MTAQAPRQATIVVRASLPVFARRRHRKQQPGGEWVSWWTTDWQEHLGGERSVWTWLQQQVEHDRSERSAARLTRLYWAVRAAGGAVPGTPFTLDQVPAADQHDVRPFVWLFEALAWATWCAACRAAPDATSGRPTPGCCWWCARAPIGRERGLWGQP